MSGQYLLYYLSSHPNEAWLTSLKQQFVVVVKASVESFPATRDGKSPDLVICESESVDSTYENLKACKQRFDPLDVILVADRLDLHDRLNMFTLGCEDCIESDLHPEELVARAQKLVFNRVANQQLKSQVEMATEAAYQAMSSTSDLGVNIQFFLDSADCQNFDELGLRAFQSFQSYGLKCSLQFRGRYETKNMEANGMAKEMESQILSELKSAGRYYDFGSRSVMNYNQVSILVKNMPTSNPERYGQIKDNVFSLLQGIDARIKALDNLKTIHREQQMIILLVARISSVLNDIDKSYMSVVRKSGEVVDDMAEAIQRMINYMGLNESQEQQLEKVIGEAIEQQQQLFGEGLKVDSNFSDLISELGGLMESSGSLDSERMISLMHKYVE
ncbi:response regulator transcription factor [Gynuella sunshinyii]|uniref:Response regulator consisting of a CheY-like receiver domain and a winged-helix DNA-binding domain n=1 Tax=Gynuella sunshinyii YC6258 TaxID=1445510 RepID=A0A0C5VVF8_9GAMM|nr:response regulator transcription factor [Gynuella sunshinyii]AJQ94449.1 response regulator consisting of a CheY-like receiver domain and a winged-helix DNA-binding domain [Gynuella sunshinyii YC6258]